MSGLVPRAPGTELTPRNAAEEQLMVALRDAAQLVFNQTGIRLDAATLTWGEQAVGDGTSRFIVRRVHVKTTMRETYRDGY